VSARRIRHAPYSVLDRDTFVRGCADLSLWSDSWCNLSSRSVSRSSDRCVNEFIDCVDSSSADCVLAVHVDINVDHLHIVMDCVVMYGLRHAVTNCAFKLQSPRCSNGMPCFVVQLFSNHWRIQEGLGGSMPLPKRPVNLFVLQKNGFQGKLLVTMQKGVQHPLTRGSAREPRWSLCLRPPLQVRGPRSPCHVVPQTLASDPSVVQTLCHVRYLDACGLCLRSGLYPLVDCHSTIISKPLTGNQISLSRYTDR